MAGEKNPNLQGGRELSYVTQDDTYYGRLFQRIISAVNTLATNTGTSAIGKLTPPPPIDNINVQGTFANNVITCPGEILHYTLQHNAPIKKGVQYLSEIDTNPNFTNPHVIDHGSSRSAFLTLPTYSAGSTLNTYYLRAYAQYPGSDACKPTVLGGLTSATQIVMSGINTTPLLSSTGSGTAAPDGSQGGKGLGVVLNRPPVQPKRFTT